MTLEARARAIADKRREDAWSKMEAGKLRGDMVIDSDGMISPAGVVPSAVEAFALEQLREAVDEAVKRVDPGWPGHLEMTV